MLPQTYTSVRRIGSQKKESVEKHGASGSDGGDVATHSCRKKILKPDPAISKKEERKKEKHRVMVSLHPVALPTVNCSPTTSRRLKEDDQRPPGVVEACMRMEGRALKTKAWDTNESHTGRSSSRSLNRADKNLDAPSEELISRPVLRDFRMRHNTESTRIRLRAHPAYPEPRTGLVRGGEGGQLANGGREREREKGEISSRRHGLGDHHMSHHMNLPNAPIKWSDDRYRCSVPSSSRIGAIEVMARMYWSKFEQRRKYEFCRRRE
ncbi:hypothetical protein B0H13DRAFT_1857202 [Mycena leptocephala]|nr:hypothetical protein B0H13DRAFT_1857202 [Mycena leptocephala]